MPESGAERAGVVALSGAPNVGKSTLLNRILGRHLSIATPKPQTTRSRVLGVLTQNNVQVVFTDTPGIHQTRGLLHERMVATARAQLGRADLVCWIVAANRGVTAVDEAELPRLVERALLVVLNKMDLVKRPDLLPVMARVNELLPGVECVPVSALTGRNVPLLIDRLADRLPEGPWLYPADILTDQSERFFVAELVREQLFEQLQQELPYRVAVQVEQYRDETKTAYIECTIYADSPSARKIILGSNGRRIKAVGKAARKQIEALIGKHAYLDLHVRIKKDWQRDARFLEELER